MPEEKPPPKPQEPPALSSEYHKARKQVLLWAGILFIWELVGIDLEKAKEVEGNAGAIITAIKSPQAIPWVLLVLVAYFLFKLWVEWNQCGGSRRETLHSRVDFWSAWVVALFAYALYGYQTRSRIQVADAFQDSYKFRSFVLGFFSLGVFFAFLSPRLQKERPPKQVLVAQSMIILALILGLILFSSGIAWSYFAFGAACALPEALFILYLFTRFSSSFD